jgi:hypothetical protein
MKNEKKYIEHILDKFKCFDKFNDVVYFDIMVKPDFRKAKDGTILDYSIYLVYEEREFNPELNTDSLSIKYFAEKERFTVFLKRGLFTEKFSVSKRVAIHKNVIKQVIELLLKKLNERYRVISNAF